MLIVFQLFLIFTDLGFGMMIAVVAGVMIWSFYVVFDAETLISGSKYDWHKNDDWLSGKNKDFLKKKEKAINLIF